MSRPKIKQGNCHDDIACNKIQDQTRSTWGPWSHFYCYSEVSPNPVAGMFYFTSLSLSILYEDGDICNYFTYTMTATYSLWTDLKSWSISISALLQKLWLFYSCSSLTWAGLLSRQLWLMQVRTQTRAYMGSKSECALGFTSSAVTQGKLQATAT